MYRHPSFLALFLSLFTPHAQQCAKNSSADKADLSFCHVGQGRVGGAGAGMPWRWDAAGMGATLPCACSSRVTVMHVVLQRITLVKTLTIIEGHGSI